MSVVIGTGSYLPKKRVLNGELSQSLDTSDSWIVQRTGIRQRHVAATTELTSDMACEAAISALASARCCNTDIDLVILATSTPDLIFPATSMQVQNKLGLINAVAFDIQAVCSGFIFALVTAHNFLQTGHYKCALVIGAETFSRIIDWTDRATCVLFGDGAGAVVVESQKHSKSVQRGILSTVLHSDGRFYDKLYVDGGVSSQQFGFLKMDGKEVFRYAATAMAQAVEEACQAIDCKPQELDWLVPHQANQRIMQSCAEKLKMDTKKIISTIADHANTSAASIPLALHVAVQDGRVKIGHLVCLVAMGAGFTWGAVIIRW